MQPLGYQYLIDLQGCNVERITDTEFVRGALLRAASEAGATIITDVFHQFNPYGVSGVVIIAESHVAIHTWPEHGFASVDFFSCSDAMSGQALHLRLSKEFQAKSSNIQVIKRGVPLRAVENASENASENGSENGSACGSVAPVTYLPVTTG